MDLTEFITKLVKDKDALLAEQNITEDQVIEVLSRSLEEELHRRVTANASFKVVVGPNTKMYVEDKNGEFLAHKDVNKEIDIFVGLQSGEIVFTKKSNNEQFKIKFKS